MNEPRRCTATTQAGTPCRAYAIHGTDPPACSAHAKRNVGAGAPAGNTNATKHGFYSTKLSPDELADLVSMVDSMTLDDEIAVCRVALRRLLDFLGNGEAGQQDTQAAARLVFQGSRTIARLLRDARALSGEAADGIAGAIAQALDELSTEWGIDL